MLQNIRIRSSVLPDGIDRTISQVLRKKRVEHISKQELLATARYTEELKLFFSGQDIPIYIFQYLLSLKQLPAVPNSKWYSEVYDSFKEEIFSNSVYNTRCECCGRTSPFEPLCKQCEIEYFYNDFYETVKNGNKEEALNYFIKNCMGI